MEYLQYIRLYQWIRLVLVVLNLIINGIPSIPYMDLQISVELRSFKPYYKWNTFNTKVMESKFNFCVKF